MHTFFKSAFSEKNSLKSVVSRTQILTLSESGFSEGLDDGKMRNVFFPKSKWCDIEKNLYD